MAIELADYDFETNLETGFKATLENEAGLSGILTSSTIGEMSDTAIAIESMVSGIATDHIVNGDYNHYSATLTIRIQTPRIASNGASTYTTHATLRALVRKALGVNLLANLAVGFATNKLTIERCLPDETRRETDDGYFISELVYRTPFSFD